MEHWFRSWHGAPTDSKWIVIAKRAQVTPGEVSAVFWALLDYASQNGQRGSINGFDAETYAAWAGWEESSVVNIIDAMRSKGVILDNGDLAAWEKRQPKRDDDSAPRVRKYRQNEAMHANVTQCNATPDNVTHGNAPDKIRSDPDTDPEETTFSAAQAQTATETPSSEHSSPAKTKTKPAKAAADASTHQLLFGAIADICLLDTKLKAGPIGKAARQLAEAGYTAEHVARFGQWWRTVDWRGRKGNTATIAQLLELIRQANEAPTVHTNGNGNGYQPADWDAYHAGQHFDNYEKFKDETPDF